MTSQTMTRMLPERRHLICTMNLLCISFHTDPSRYTLVTFGVEDEIVKY